MTNIIDSTATDVTTKQEETKDTTFGGLVGSKSKAKRAKAQKKETTAKTVKTPKAAKAKTAAEIVADRIAGMAGEVTVIEPSVTKNLPVSALQVAVSNARSIHRAMKANFIDGITQIAEQVIKAKEAAKAEGVKFDSLFGNPDDATQFPFSQNWANTIVRVYESKLLTGSDTARLPSDLTTLATLASTRPEKREAVLRRYEEIRTGDVNFIEGEIVLAKVTTQKAMKKAKAEVDGDGEEEGKSVAKKKPPQFNATRMAKALHKELGDDGLSELADAIDMLLQDAGVR